LSIKVKVPKQRLRIYIGSSGQEQKRDLKLGLKERLILNIFSGIWTALVTQSWPKCGDGLLVNLQAFSFVHELVQSLEARRQVQRRLLAPRRLLIRRMIGCDSRRECGRVRGPLCDSRRECGSLWTERGPLRGEVGQGGVPGPGQSGPASSIRHVGLVGGEVAGLIMILCGEVFPGSGILEEGLDLLIAGVVGSWRRPVSLLDLLVAGEVRSYRTPRVEPWRASGGTSSWNCLVETGSS